MKKKCTCQNSETHQGFEYKYDCRCCTSGHKLLEKSFDELLYEGMKSEGGK